MKRLVCLAAATCLSMTLALPASSEGASVETAKSATYRHALRDSQTAVDMFFESSPRGTAGGQLQFWMIVSVFNRAPQTFSDGTPWTMAGSLHLVDLDCAAGTAKSEVGAILMDTAEILQSPSGPVIMREMSLADPNVAQIFSGMCAKPLPVGGTLTIKDALALAPVG